MVRKTYSNGRTHNLIKTILVCMGCLWLAGCSSTQPTVERSEYVLRTDGEIPEIQQGLTVNHVDLAIEVFPKQKSIQGRTKLLLKTDRSRKQVGINLDNLFVIDSVKVNGKHLGKSQYSNDIGLLVIQSEEELSNTFSIEVAYSGSPREALNAPWDGGFVWQKTPDGQDWIATAVQGEGCDLFWPCIDYPIGEPATLNIDITVPANLFAASNGVLLNTTDNGLTNNEKSNIERTKTYHWQTKSPHNNYGIALNIGPYEVLTQQHQSIYGNSYPIVFYHLKESTENAVALMQEIHSLIDFFERYIGPYPFNKEKVGIVETPHLGMEHQTINAYGNEFKPDQFGFDWLLNHEFAHEWFANQVTNTNADHMWIHEAFGTYMQPLYSQYLHGDAAYFANLYNYRMDLVNESPIVSDKVLNVSEVYNDGPGQDLYYKGALVLHTLRSLIGDQAFFDSIKRLLYDTITPNPDNIIPRFADTNDYIGYVTELTRQDVNWFFNVYLRQAKLPELVVERGNTQMMFKWKVENDLPFPMPVEVSVNGRIQTLDMNSTSVIDVTNMDIVIIDPDSKILRHQPHFERYQTWMKQQKN